MFNCTFAARVRVMEMTPLLKSNLFFHIQDFGFIQIGQICFHHSVTKISSIEINNNITADSTLLNSESMHTTSSSRTPGISNTTHFPTLPWLPSSSWFHLSSLHHLSCTLLSRATLVGHYLRISVHGFESDFSIASRDSSPLFHYP